MVMSVTTEVSFRIPGEEDQMLAFMAGYKKEDWKRIETSSGWVTFAHRKVGMSGIGEDK